MTYIIENVKMVRRDKLETMSLLVKDDKILSVKPDFPKYLYMKMNATNFVMTSTYVFVNMSIPNITSDKEIKQYFTSRYIMNGCTTVIAVASIQDIRVLEQERNKIVEFFSKSSLDYTVAIKIPVQLLTVPLIQKCKQLKIPAIFIEYEDKRSLYKIPWGWIREAMFPYNSPLIPIPIGNDEEIEDLLYHWHFILERERIPHILYPLNEDSPLDLDVLKQIGIYPLKGYLQAGGELSYNLFLSNTGRKEDQEKQSLVVTVHKGKIIRVGSEANFIPENSEEITILKPSFFK